MNSLSGRGRQPGWCISESSSTYGTPIRLASERASVDLPEPLVPTTETRRTGANLGRRGWNQLGEVDRRVAESSLRHGLPAFDQLASKLVGLGVVNREHCVDQAVPQVEDREGKTVAIATPDRAVIARRLPAILEVHVVLVGPEVRQLRVRGVASGDVSRDAAAMILRDLPVLDADRATKHRMRMHRDVPTAIDAIGCAERAVDLNTATLDGQSECSRQVDVGVDAHRLEHEVDLLAAAAGQRDGDYPAAVGVPFLDFGAGPHVDASGPVNRRVDLSHVVAERSRQGYGGGFDEQHLLAQLPR